MSLSALAPEWRRVEHLCDILIESRARTAATPERLTGLEALQAQVLAVRAAGAWAPLGAAGLSAMALDILACAAAAEVSHVAAFAYRALSGDAATRGVGVGLLQALLSLEPEDYPALAAELRFDAPLQARGLVVIEGGQQPDIRLSRNALIALVGEAGFTTPPGAVAVRRPAGWNDLILPEACKRSLAIFETLIRQRRRVEEDWGAAPQGGPIALFSGPSGSGKTLAARVIANTIGRPLYRIDLGRIVDKYIGQTEKNLSALFEAAEGANCVLLFDEADALFGKRGEVNDARDRYANMEVSHLLSLIEDQSCPCILTSNLKRSIDAAFLRRFHIVVDFALPDEAEREQLWRLHLPPRAPLGRDIDLGLLARHARLTGAGIANAARYGAVMAAERGSPIGMADLVNGGWSELTKEGARHSMSDLGPLAAYLREGSDVDDQASGSAAAA